MTPAWILPVFPAMLLGTVASLLSASQPPVQRLPMLVAGLMYQGLGFLVSLVMMALYLYRLMIDGLPAASLRPGMFMAVGPPSFTSIALIGLAKNIPDHYAYFAAHPLAADALRPVALAFSLFLWLFGAFFFAISAVACLAAIREMRFSLIFWAFVFPNTGFTVVTIDIGNELGSEGVKWVGSAMSICLVVAWLANLVFQGRAIVLGHMLWPGRDEDRDELQSVKSRGD
jgi:tellurite resistance protein TehA-like permease